jgi:hypothetical protein
MQLYAGAAGNVSVFPARAWHFRLLLRVERGGFQRQDAVGSVPGADRQPLRQLALAWEGIVVITRTAQDAGTTVRRLPRLR